MVLAAVRAQAVAPLTQIELLSQYAGAAVEVYLRHTRGSVVDHPASLDEQSKLAPQPARSVFLRQTSGRPLTTAPAAQRDVSTQAALPHVWCSTLGAFAAAHAATERSHTDAVALAKQSPTELAEYLRHDAPDTPAIQSTPIQKTTLLISRLLKNVEPDCTWSAEVSGNALEHWVDATPQSVPAAAATLFKHTRSGRSDWFAYGDPGTHCVRFRQPSGHAV